MAENRDFDVAGGVDFFFEKKFLKFFFVTLATKYVQNESFSLFPPLSFWNEFSGGKGGIWVEIGEI